MQTYLNSEVLTLTRALINGVNCNELELMLAEGLGFGHSSQPSEAKPGRRDRCHIEQYPLNAGPLEKLQVLEKEKMELN